MKTLKESLFDSDLIEKDLPEDSKVKEIKKKNP